MITSVRRAALSCALLATTAFCGLNAAPAAAQQKSLPPQKEYYIGGGNVELHRGAFLYSHQDISIGDEAAGGLALTRYHGVTAVGGGSEIVGTHSLAVGVHREEYLDGNDIAPLWSHRFYLVIGRTVESFDLHRESGVTSVPIKGGGTFSLASRTGPFTYTAGDGTVTHFGTLTSCPSVFYAHQCSPATSIVKPNGATIRFAYDTVTTDWGGPFPRLRLVTSSHGFGLGFEHLTGRFGALSRVCALNLALSYASTSQPCPAGAVSATYGYTQPSPHTLELTSFTDTSGQTTYYTYNDLRIATIQGPGSPSPDLINSFDPNNYKLVSQTYRNGATWNYTYQNVAFPWWTSPQNEWTEVTSPLGHKVRHTFGGGAPKPSFVLDAVGRTSEFRYVTNRPYLLERQIEPDGNYVQYSYDSRDNVTETRLVAKPGSGLADIVTTASYPACGNQKTCNKPASRTDARGNVTDYTYDPVHGGVLTETGPAVNGVRPQKRYSYAQKQAWVKDASGALAPSGSPVWVVTEEAQCLTAAACTGGADEVRVTYDWGPPGAGPLLLRGKVVDPGGLSLRTCYGYDGQGNRISETEPKAGLTSCP